MVHVAMDWTPLMDLTTNVCPDNATVKAAYRTELKKYDAVANLTSVAPVIFSIGRLSDCNPRPFLLLGPDLGNCCPSFTLTCL